MQGKPNWVSWVEYLQQHSRHYEPLRLEPHDVAGLLKHLREIEQNDVRRDSMDRFDFCRIP
jgi:hypothetical protein